MRYKANLRITLLTLLAILLAALPVAAQSELSQSFTTSRGVTVQHSDSWIPGEDNGVVLVNLLGTVSMSIRVDEDIAAAYSDYTPGGTPSDALAAVSSELVAGGVTLNESQTIQISGQDATEVKFSFPGLGNVNSLITYALPTGETVLIEIFAFSGEPLSDEISAEIIAIAETVSFNPDDSVAASQAAAEPTEGGFPPPAEALLPSEMPDNTIILSTGTSFQYSTEQFDVSEPDSEVYSNIVFISDDFLTSVSVMDLGDDFANFSQAESFLRITGGIYVALGTDDPNFDPSNFVVTDYFEEITLETGKQALFWQAARPDELAIALYIVEANPGNFVWIQGQQIESADPDAFLALIRQMADTLLPPAAATPSDDGAASPDDSATDAETTTEATTSDAEPSTDTATGEVPSLGDISCTDTAQMWDASIGDQVDVNCPANCTAGSLWGTDIYTNDSSICTAAVHAGVITEIGGTVRVTITEPQATFVGSERNGVTSSSYEGDYPTFSLSQAQ